MFYQIFRDGLRQNVTASEARRLLDVWLKYSSSQATVPLSELGPHSCAFAAKFMSILERQPNASYVYEYFGEAISMIFGADMTGQTTRILTSNVGPLLEATYDDVLKSGKPTLLVHRASNSANVPLWEQLIFPVINASNEARILVHARPRETDQELLAALLDASPEGVSAFQAVRNEAGHIVDALFVKFNKRAVELSGVSDDQLMSKTLLELFPGIIETGIWDRYLKVMTDQKADRFEVNLRQNGIDRCLRIAAVPFGDGFMISYNDITEFKLLLDDANKTRQDLALEIEARQILEGELRRMATMDGLTGILNRRGYEEVLGRVAKQAKQTGQPLSVISFDLDHFKHVNDKYGHSAGDIVLMSVVSSVAEQMQKDTDSFSRVGGEEFMLLLPNTSTIEAAATAERLRSAIESTPIYVDDNSLNVTASFGVHCLASGCDTEEMMVEVDMALYKSKQDGRNRVTVF